MTGSLFSILFYNLEFTIIQNSLSLGIHYLYRLITCYSLSLEIQYQFHYKTWNSLSWRIHYLYRFIICYLLSLEIHYQFHYITWNFLEPTQFILISHEIHYQFEIVITITWNSLSLSCYYKEFIINNQYYDISWNSQSVWIHYQYY